MTPLLHPLLVNDRFGDPALYVEFLFEKRALLFDLGDLHALGPRKILRISDIFVSHAHIDHFIGFDRVLRVLLGREKHVRLYGPAGIIDRVAHKLASYSWNLADRFSSELAFTVTEVCSASRARSAQFRLANAFSREAEADIPFAGTFELDGAAFKVHLAVLDHRIPCLAFAVEERAHVNVWKNRLDELGLPTGPWLRALKEAVLSDQPDQTDFLVSWRAGGDVMERHFPLGELKRRVLQIVAGQKIGYVVDVLFNGDNRRRISDLVRDADILFIEAAFARDEAERAADRYHLTTEQAGLLAREARVKRLEPFHFSPRYAGQEERLRREVEAAFQGAAL